MKRISMENVFLLFSFSPIAYESYVIPDHVLLKTERTLICRLSFRLYGLPFVAGGGGGLCSNGRVCDRVGFVRTTRACTPYSIQRR